MVLYDHLNKHAYKVVISNELIDMSPAKIIGVAADVDEAHTESLAAAHFTVILVLAHNMQILTVYAPFS